MQGVDKTKFTVNHKQQSNILKRNATIILQMVLYDIYEVGMYHVDVNY